MIARFGSPATVTGRIWLDAMKGTFMAQRILIATCFVMVAACFGLVGFVWSESNRWSQVNLVLIDQTQRTNQEILKQLETLAKSPQTPRKSDEWIPVSFKLTVEKPDGPPAVGYEIWLGKGEGGSRKDGAIRRYTDDKGLADFGVIRPGDWEYRIQADCDDGRYWFASWNLNAVPGTKVFEQIRCPRRPPDRGAVRVRVAWPEDLSSQNLHLIALFRLKAHTYQGPPRWWLSDPQDQQSTRSREILCGPGSQQAEIVSENYPYFWRPATQIEARTSRGERGLLLPDPVALTGSPDASSEASAISNRVYAEFNSTPEFSDSGGIEIEAGKYRPERLIVLQTRAATKPGRGTDQFEVLAMGGGPSITPGARDEASGKDIPYAFLEARVLQASTKTQSLRGMDDAFEAQAGQVKEWTITLPGELIKAVRGKLAAKK